MVTEFKKNMLKISRLIVCLGALLLCSCVEIPEYAVVNIKASPPQGGTVSSNPPGPEYNIGMIVTFNAVAKPGYKFGRWEGCLSGTSNTVTKTITGDKYNEDITATAYFAKMDTLRVYVTPADGGIVTVSPPPETTFTKGTSTIYVYETGTRVRAVAQVSVDGARDFGYKFYKWTGASQSTDTIITITMGRDTSLNANFAKVYTLTVNVNQKECGTVTIDPPSPYFDSTYNDGQPVNLVAAPNPGSNPRCRFDGWSGDDTTSTSTAIRLTMNRRWNVTAKFVKMYKLSVVISPTGGGTVDISPRPPRDSTYDDGTVVIPNAVPNSGYRFDGWSGDMGGTTPTITIPMNRDRNIMAKFVKVYKLTVTDKTANGGILGSPRETKPDAGTQVTVTASNRRPNYRFDGWFDERSGALMSRDSVYRFYMDGDKELFAKYVRLFRLTLINDPTNGGTITTEPPGHPGYDPVTYDSGTVVTVKAEPKAGYRFSRWSGASTSTSTTTSFTMNGNKELTAIYTRVTYTLRINVSPAGSGTVEVEVNGTTIPYDGPMYIDEGASVTVTAIAENGYIFSEWSGALTSTSPTISFTAMNGDKTLTAKFSQ